MLSLDDRIKLLKDDLIADPPSFVMTRELPFAIFRYDPHIPAESEWIVRRKIQLLGTQVENETHQHVATVSMASLFWRSIQESEDVAGLIALEHDHSYAVAERQVNQYLSDPDFRPLCDLLRKRKPSYPRTRALSSLRTRRCSRQALIVFHRYLNNCIAASEPPPSCFIPAPGTTR